MPASFTFPERDVDLWIGAIYYAVLTVAPERVVPALRPTQSPGSRSTKRAPTSTSSRAQLGARVSRHGRDLGVYMEPLKDTIVGGARGSLWLLFAAVSVLLLIACTNIARCCCRARREREQEIAVRFSLGSSRWAVAHKCLTETGGARVVGAAAGCSASRQSRRLRCAGRGRLPAHRRDRRRRADCCCTRWLRSSVVTLLCGSRRRFAARARRPGAPRRRSRTQVSGRHSLQWLFVGVQVDVVGRCSRAPGLLVRSFQELGASTRGSIPTTCSRFESVPRMPICRAQLRRRLQQRNAMLERARGAAGRRSGRDLLAGARRAERPSGFEIRRGRSRSSKVADDTRSAAAAETRIVSPSYFATMRIPVLAGELCRLRHAERRCWNGDRGEPSFVDRYASAGRSSARPTSQAGHS